VRVARRAVKAGEESGLRFFFPGFDEPLTARDFAALQRRAHRATILTHPVSGAVLRTPEHLLAAALFFADAPLDITCDAAEIPGLDGSAWPWFELLSAAEHPVAEPPHPHDFSCREYETSLKWSYEGPEGRMSAEPAEYFSVTYTLERGTFHETYRLESASEAPLEVLPARTFIFWNDWETVRGSTASSIGSVLGGADTDSGLLLAESPEEHARALRNFPENSANAYPLLHPRAFRLKGEAARHKVLDLLGDLALNGLALPKLKLTITNGGHALNHLLLDALIADRSGINNTTYQGTAS